jgi:predicted acyl esterase
MLRNDPDAQLDIDNGIMMERDVAVSLCDGVIIYVDVYRPADGRQGAPIMFSIPARFPKRRVTRRRSGVDRALPRGMIAFSGSEM